MVDFRNYPIITLYDMIESTAKLALMRAIAQGKPITVEVLVQNFKQFLNLIEGSAEKPDFDELEQRLDRRSN